MEGHINIITYHPVNKQTKKIVANKENSTSIILGENKAIWRRIYILWSYPYKDRKAKTDKEIQR